MNNIVDIQYFFYLEEYRISGIHAEHEGSKKNP